MQKKFKKLETEPEPFKEGNPLAALEESKKANQTPKKELKPAAEVLHNQNPLKALRSYKGDVADVIKEKSMSITSMVSAEQKRNEKKERKIKKGPIFQSTFFYTISLVLLWGAGAVLLFLFSINRLNRPQKISEDSTIISYNEKLEIYEVSEGNNVLSKIESAKKEAQDEGFIVYASLSERPKSDDFRAVSASDFLSIVAPQAPQRILRILDGKFMYAFLNKEDGEVSPFLILKVKDFASAFSRMLDWESGMYRDLKSIISPYKEGGLGGEVAPADDRFEDLIVVNKDIRALIGNNGQVLILYAFLNQDTLFIGPDEITFKEVFEAFISQ